MTANTMDSGAPATVTTSQQRTFNGRGIFNKVVVTSLALLLLLLFLAPLLNMFFISLKTTEQMTEPGAPQYPAEPATFEYDGEVLPVYEVPMADGSVQELAMVQPGRQESTFIDPNNPEAGPIVWEGSWRTLERPWTWSPTWSNYPEAWNTIDFPRLFFNTVMIALFGIIGTLISCTLVAYGFSRFRFPGRDVLFLILIATIFMPAAVTIVPTYWFFLQIGWVGTWLPLIVPHFFANAYNVFLLRQYFMTIPPEIDEAAAIDGANPLQILQKIIVPMSKPVIIAVTLFHLVFAWNDYFEPLIYLSTRPDLQPIAVGLASFNGIYGSNPPLIQAAALMAAILPIFLFFISQNVFMQGVVVTGVEK